MEVIKRPLCPLAMPLRQAQEPCKTRKNGRVEGMMKSYPRPSNLVVCPWGLSL